MTIRAIISRAEAKAQGLIRYFTGIPCKHGHICERNVASWGCIECRAIGNSDWYKKNPLPTWSDSKRKAKKANIKAKRKQNADHVFELKRASGCSKCGFDHPAALHFHHLDGKITEVSKMVRGFGASLNTILTEIDKCIVLCANCHAIEHWNETQNKKGVA